MKIPISPRLKACCNFIRPGDRVADIGCDHGYLGIYLLTQGIAQYVIASDIRKMPLQSAIENSAKFGVKDKMSFYLSDGARSIPRDFDTLVCAGMGADTIISVLEGAIWLKNKDYRLVLQCQSKTPSLRKYLWENGWRIEKETVLRDGRFLYTVMQVVYQPDSQKADAGQFYFPALLLEQPTEQTTEYYCQCVKKLEIMVANRKDEVDPEIRETLAYLKNLPLSKEEAK